MPKFLNLNKPIAFLERLVPFIKPDFTTRFSGKKSIVLAYTQGNPDGNTFKTYFDYVEKLFSFMSFDVKGTILAPGTREKDDILQQIELIEKAKEIGRGLVIQNE